MRQRLEKERLAKDRYDSNAAVIFLMLHLGTTHCTSYVSESPPIPPQSAAAADRRMRDALARRREVEPDAGDGQDEGGSDVDGSMEALRERVELIKVLSSFSSGS